ETPEVSVRVTKGNQTFYFPGEPVGYAVTVSDREDGTSTEGKITASDVTVTFDYLKGFDMTSIAQGHQRSIVEMPGKALMDASDCKSCHLVDQKSAGPSYADIAKRYKNNPDAVNLLADKIIRGGSGQWGTIEMAAHPQISVED